MNLLIESNDKASSLSTEAYYDDASNFTTSMAVSEFTVFLICTLHIFVSSAFKIFRAY